MECENREVSSASICDSRTGEPVVYKNFDEVELEKYETNKRHSNAFKWGATLEIDFSEDISDEIHEVFGIDAGKFPDKYNIEYMKPYQIRTHKKKRINKKWAKRYGYGLKKVTEKGWELSTFTDGSFVFTK